MALQAPKIDPRNIKDILGEIRSLTPFYQPAWDARLEKGPGAALMQIFAKMLEGLVKRLNEVPQLNFIEFLNTLGIKLFPAQPARAPITFVLSAGAAQPAEIPERSQIAGDNPTGGDPLIFETKRAILATPALLQALFSVVPELAKDQIFDHLNQLNEGQPTTFFAETENLQQHVLHIAHADFFNLEKEAEIRVRFTPALAELRDGTLVEWSYFGKSVRQRLVMPERAGEEFAGDQSEEEGWHRLDLASRNGFYINAPRLRFNHATGETVEPVEFMKSTARNFTLRANVLAGSTSLTVRNATGLLPGSLLMLQNSSRTDWQEVVAVEKVADNQRDVTIRGNFLFNYQAGNATVTEVQEELPGHAPSFKISSEAPAGSRFLHLDTVQGIEKEKYVRVGEKMAGDQTAEYQRVLLITQETSASEILLLKRNRLTFDATAGTSGKIGEVIEETTGEIGESKINALKNRWIRCRVKAGKIGAVRQALINEIKTTTTAFDPDTFGSGQAEVLPDMLFTNDIEVEVKKPFYPFGLRPRLSDTCFIASGEVFSKKGAQITLIPQFAPSCIQAPKLRFSHSKNSPVTKTDVAILFSTKLINAAAKEDNQIEVTDSSGISAGDWLQIAENGKHEFVSVNWLDGNLIGLNENLLMDHPVETLVHRVDLTDSSPLVQTTLRSEALDTDVCLDLTSAAGFRNLDVVKIDAGANVEYQLLVISKPSGDAILAWEYWNGQGWTALSGLSDGTDRFSQDGEVVFTCPENLEVGNVNGQENFWIRVRLVNGDYGTEEFRVKTTVNQSGSSQKDFKLDSSSETIRFSNFRPPKISSLKLRYSAQGAFPDAVQTLNNLEYADQTVNSKFGLATYQPFVEQEDERQALYFGFDRPPLKGPISIFVGLEEQEYIEKALPRLDWQYYRKKPGQASGEWTRLEVQDGTQNLTETGTIEFIGPEDFEIKSRFGTPRYWIRAVDRESPAFALRKSAETLRADASGQQTTRCGQPVCEARLRTFHPTFTISGDLLSIPAAPVATGVFLNTTWASQRESITDEILGSSDGALSQRYSLLKSPVVEEEIWVNEFGSLSEAERKDLLENSAAVVQEVKDENDQVVEFWIRWQATEDLTGASANDRVYEIDRSFGLIQFGDGIHGMVPPIGRDNIKANYRSGGGQVGNLDKGLITSLRSSIPFVDKAENPEAAAGGSDTELLEAALVRAPHSLKNRGAAVTVEDFEWIAREASRRVARVKCLPNFNDAGLPETNWVTVVIVPDSPEARPFPSPPLRTLVRKYLRDRAANVSVFPEHIQVTGPTYVEVSIRADIYPQRFEFAPEVEKNAFAGLAAFLHPLTGGYRQTGWEFGRLPCLSDFYLLLEAIEGVDYVENLSMRLQAISPTGEILDEEEVDENRPLDSSMPQYALIFSGDHQIVVKPLG